MPLASRRPTACCAHSRSWGSARRARCTSVTTRPTSTRPGRRECTSRRRLFRTPSRRSREPARRMDGVRRGVRVAQLCRPLHRRQARPERAVRVVDGGERAHPVRRDRFDRLCHRRAWPAPPAARVAPPDVMVGRAPRQRRDRDRDGSAQRRAGPRAPPGPRAGRDPRHLAAEPRGGVRRQRPGHLHRRAGRRGAGVSRPRLRRAGTVRAVDGDPVDRRRVRPRARARRGLSLPRRLRHRPRLPPLSGEQRLSRDDRPRALQRGRPDRCRFRQTAAGEYCARMRWGLVVLAALLIAAPSATAARREVTIQATPTAGAAPLQVVFTASGASAAHWDFGDGTAADGVTVDHTYAAGRWTATATAQASDGSTSTQTVSVTATGLTLKAPSAGRYAQRVVFRGTVVPAERGVIVHLSGPGGGRLGTAKTTAAGTYAIKARARAPG